MTTIAFRFSATIAVSILLIIGSSAAVGAQSAALRQAKTAAEAKGYLFETNHDEIVAKAQKEGKLRFLSSWDAKLMDQMGKALKKKYPFMDVTVGEHGSVESAQRFLLELKAGRGKEWDVARLYTEFYDQYTPFLKKFDLRGMAEQNVLVVPSEDGGSANAKFHIPHQ